MSNCIICGGLTRYFFSKEYTTEPYASFMHKLGTVEYRQCQHCGFVLSATHAQANHHDWQELNALHHNYVETHFGCDNIPNQPPYLEQASMLALLKGHGLISMQSGVDFAGGYGRLSGILHQYFALELPVYDPFVQNKNGQVNYLEHLAPHGMDLVVNSAMFEHIRCREDLDQINRVVADSGALVLHTVICENIPNDPHWFYLDPPVHSAFHTNKSMSVLMEQWGYVASIYSVKAKSWCLLKQDLDDGERAIAKINEELQQPFFIYKKGFVDYWK
ncbi:methyltransferase domain-containing protein [Shewanella sp. NIFS-20-20]|uniref:methyltransferase domain-containing protein n=1 Tax=Shewanella sp. NIFS-20-20 TaxID=2853806 RepID=UPI001C4571C2|nr:methyltransferase domain-containing protein [Shewanella sp. NIFS-20-20]MBV7316376.1 class I SAM-dependent methyltransferase [Shewanella sp. NIFS-20-20]